MTQPIMKATMKQQLKLWLDAFMRKCGYVRTPPPLGVTYTARDIQRILVEHKLTKLDFISFKEPIDAEQQVYRELQTKLIAELLHPKNSHLFNTFEAFIPWERHRVFVMEIAVIPSANIKRPQVNDTNNSPRPVRSGDSR